MALGGAMRSRNARLATAESCTGGMIAAACTAVPGSSDWFERGFVTYSNEAKCEMLGVNAGLIAQHGAVSAPVACAMADGALARSNAQLAVAVTGVAGPSGGTPDKPVGTVWLALAQSGAPAAAERLQLNGDRAAVRQQTTRIALQRLLDAADAPARRRSDAETPDGKDSVS
ncbi:MAG: CinA family protein [Rhizobacter sp.]|nr:CinA family protein [Rhizobacter sp.]